MDPTRSSPHLQPQYPHEMPSNGSDRRKNAISHSSNSTSDSIGSISTINASQSQSSISSEANHLVPPPHVVYLSSPSFEEIKDIVKKLQFEFQSTKRFQTQYLYLMGLSSEVLTQLEHREGVLLGIRVTFLFRQRQALIKVMPGRHHGITGAFKALIQCEFFQRGLYARAGHWKSSESALLKNETTAKEPDWWLGPGFACPNDQGQRETPSLALEVGFSESLSQLHADAHWWYHNTNGATKLIVLIHASHRANQPQQTVGFEVWTEVYNHQGPETQRRPQKVIRCTQRAEVVNGVVVSGGPLELDLEMILRRDRRPGETNIVLSLQDLVFIAAGGNA